MKASSKVVEYKPITQVESYLETRLNERGIKLGKVEISLMEGDGPFAVRLSEGLGAKISYARWFRSDVSDQLRRMTLDTFVQRINDPKSCYEIIDFDGTDTTLSAFFYSGHDTHLNFESGKADRVAKHVCDYTGFKADLDGVKKIREIVTRWSQYEEIIGNAIKANQMDHPAVIDMLLHYFLKEKKVAG